MKKTVLIALVLCLLLSLTACGGGDKDNSNSLVSSEFVYVPEYFTIDGADIDDIQYATYKDGTIYFVSYGVVGTREPDPQELEWNNGVIEDWMTEEYGTLLCKVNVDGSGYTKLEGYKPLEVPNEEGVSASANINSFALDPEGNIWVFENIYSYNTDDNGDWLSDNNSYYLRKLDANGVELSVIDLNQISENNENGYINLMCMDGHGLAYFSGDDSKIFALDTTTGEVSFDVSLGENGWVNSMLCLANGNVGVSTYDENGSYVIKEIDAASKDFGKTYKLPTNAYRLYTGGGEYAVYCSDDSYLYGVNLETGETTALLNWIDSDINTNDMRTVLPLDDGRVLCINYTYNEDGDDYSGSPELVILTKTPASEVPEKTVITMATMWLNYDARAAIIKFNKTNSQYRIQVNDYSVFNTEEDYNAGFTKLNTEIITGNVPDIIDLSNLPMSQYVAKGLLEDLYPYIDNDEELSREALVQEALKAMEVDGHLYQATPSFSVETVIGLADVVGSEPGWTFDDLKATLAAHPEATAFAPYITRDSILYYCYLMNQSEYVNWQTGECKFDTEDFISLLEFVNSLPAEYNWEEEEVYVDEMTQIAQGKVLLSLASVYSFDDIYSRDVQYGGKISYIGFPSSSGCGSVLSTDSGLAISSTSQNKEGAWEFVRTLLTEKYQEKNSWAIPTNKAVFEKRAQEAMTNETSVDENGNEIILPKYIMENILGEEVEVYAMTQEQYDQFMQLLSKIDSTASYDTSILEIIQEDAAAFFAGQKTAAETASIIQSRVSIYVNEQR